MEKKRGIRQRTDRVWFSRLLWHPPNGWIFPAVVCCRWLGDRKGIQYVKRWVLVCWWRIFDWNFARLIAPVVTTTSILLSSSKFRMGTFCYRLTQVHLENGRWNGESERGKKEDREEGRDMDWAYGDRWRLQCYNVDWLPVSASLVMLLCQWLLMTY